MRKASLFVWATSFLALGSLVTNCNSSPHPDRVCRYWESSRSHQHRAGVDDRLGRGRSSSQKAFENTCYRPVTRPHANVDAFRFSCSQNFGPETGAVPNLRLIISGRPFSHWILVQGNERAISLAWNQTPYRSHHKNNFALSRIWSPDMSLARIDFLIAPILP